MHGRNLSISATRSSVLRVCWLLTASCCLLAFGLGTPAVAQPTPPAQPAPAQQHAALHQIRAQLKQAGVLFREGQGKASARALAAARQQLAELAVDAKTQSAAKPLAKSLDKAILALKSKGIELPQLVDVEDARSPTSTPAPNPESDADGSGDSPVRFSVELAGLLAEKCTGCHSGRRARQQLRIETFTSLLQGSDDGPIIKPGDPGSSLLIGKLKGTADGDRMPQGEAPFTDEEIAKFERWIQDGANLDVPNPNLELDRLATAALRADMTTAELDDKSKATAKQNWRLAFPGTEPLIEQTAHFLLVGPAESHERLVKLGQAAESALRQSLKFLNQDAVSRGRMTLYGLPKRYDYAEFMHMVDKRDTQPTDLVVWSGRDADGFISSGPTDGSNKPHLDLMLQHTVTALMLHRWGAPHWYADGLGRVVRFRENRRKTRELQLIARKPISSIKSADLFLKEKIPANVSAIANWSFAHFLASAPRRQSALHQQLKAGVGFDVAFAKAYGDKTEVICNAWLVRNGGGKKKK